MAYAVQLAERRWVGSPSASDLIAPPSPFLARELASVTSPSGRAGSLRSLGEPPELRAFAGRITWLTRQCYWRAGIVAPGGRAVALGAMSRMPRDARRDRLVVRRNTLGRRRAPRRRAGRVSPRDAQDVTLGSARLDRSGRVRGRRARARPRSLRIRAQRWVDEGRTRHYAVVPDARRSASLRWLRLSFGSARHTASPSPWPPGTRRADRSDLEALIALAPLVSDHHEPLPSSAASSGTNRRTSCTPSSAEIADVGLASSCTSGTGRSSRASSSLPSSGSRCTAASRSPIAPCASRGRRAGRTFAARARVSR